jgi:hypothetical protein
LVVVTEPCARSAATIVPSRMLVVVTAPVAKSAAAIVPSSEVCGCQDPIARPGSDRCRSAPACRGPDLHEALAAQPVQQVGVQGSSGPVVVQDLGQAAPSIRSAAAKVPSESRYPCRLRPPDQPRQSYRPNVGARDSARRQGRLRQLYRRGCGGRD